jgi:hypothetical protein
MESNDLEKQQFCKLILNFNGVCLNKYENVLEYLNLFIIS